MKNVWFIRTDKDNCTIIHDISERNKFIYSAHGSCGNQNHPEIQKHKSDIFPELLINGQELRELVRSIKQKLVEEDYFSDDDPGKLQCDLFISYWISEMCIGDIAFVRNKKQEIFVCKITGYVSEEFFNKEGCFQRPIEILKKLSDNDFQDNEQLSKIWHRTLGRRTLERNRNEDTRNYIKKYLEGINTYI